ncbi:MAG: hypothetical protein ACREQC_01550 [Candidatus Binataceae bacterium]
MSVTAVENWDAAVANLQKVAAASSAARQAVEGLNKSGVFPDGHAYVRTLTDLGKIDQAQIAAANFLQTVPNDWGQSTQMQVQAYTQTIGALVNDLTANGTIGIKDAASQSTVKTSIDAITAAVKLILDLFAPVAVPASLFRR